MRNVLTITGRELRSYFSSPVAYVLLAAYLGLAGWFFFTNLRVFSEYLRFYSAIRSDQIGRLNLNEHVMAPVLSNLSVWLIFIVPAITMRMFPEEKRAGTYELLLTSPLRPLELVLGKFLSGLVLVLLMVGLSGLFGFLLTVYGDPEIPVMLSGYLGLALMAVAMLSLGTLVSSLTENVAIAYVGTVFSLLMLYTIGWLGESVLGAQGSGVRYLSIVEHFQELLKGTIGTKDLAYFGSLVVISLFLTQRSVESVRWR